MRCLSLARWLASGTFILTFLVAPTAWSQPEPAADAPGSDPNGLARYAPAQGLRFYLEFQGTEAQPDAWRQTAASQILQETKTGAMLGEILTQIIDQGLAPLPGGKLAGADANALTQHALRAGFLYAQAGTAEKPSTVLVIRDAMREENQQALAHVLAASGLAGPDTQVAEKPGGRRVASSKADPASGWWVEKNGDLVFANPIDPVIATLDSQSNASTHPDRQALAQPDGDFLPIGLAFAEVAPGSLPDQAGPLGLKDLKKLTFRCGFEGASLREEFQVVAPRSGLLDQPTFKLEELPAMPEGIEGFAVLSLDPSKTYGILTDLVRGLGGPESDLAVKLDGFEEAIKKRTRKDLRGEILSQLGPKITYYVLPSDSAGESDAADSRPAVFAGFQVPKAVVTIDAKEARKFSAVLSEMIGAFNDQAQEAAEPSDDKKDAPGDAGQAKSKSKKSFQVAEFRMISVEPPTWLLSLPSAISALTNLRLTVTIGQEHVIIGTTPDAAREALAFEEKKDAKPGPPQGELGQAIEGLTGPFIFLKADGPNPSRAEKLANLPTSLQMSLRILATNPLAQLAASPTPDSKPESDQGRSGRSGQSGASAGALDPMGGGVGIPPTAPNSGSPAPDQGQKSDEPGGISFEYLPRVRLQIPEESRPDPQAIAGHLVPCSLAVVSGDQGLRVITREAFPDLNTAGSVVFGAILGSSTEAAPATPNGPNPGAGGPGMMVPPGP